MAIEIVDLPIENGGSFHSYVSLPEGNSMMPLMPPNLFQTFPDYPTFILGLLCSTIYSIFRSFYLQQPVVFLNVFSSPGGRYDLDVLVDVKARDQSKPESLHHPSIQVEEPKERGRRGYSKSGKVTNTIQYTHTHIYIYTYIWQIDVDRDNLEWCFASSPRAPNLERVFFFWQAWFFSCRTLSITTVKATQTREATANKRSINQK